MDQSEEKAEPAYIKSGYLYNLTKVIHWPENAFNFTLSPFIFGIFGDESMNFPLIKTLREKTVKGREWKVEYYKNPKEIRHCHLIFITGAEKELMLELLEHVGHLKLLTIGDNIEGFCKIGGMINLVGESPNLGYEINEKSIEKARLTIDANFLDLATIFR